MQMNVIFTYYTFQNLHIQRIASLPNQVATTHLYIATEHLIPIFGAPHQMGM